MLQIQKNKDVIEDINKLQKRVSQLKDAKFLFANYLARAQELYTHHAKKIKEES